MSEKRRAGLMDLITARVEAHLDGDGQRCAELDIAGEDYTNYGYNEKIRYLEKLSDDQLRFWLKLVNGESVAVEFDRKMLQDLASIIDYLFEHESEDFYELYDTDNDKQENEVDKEIVDGDKDYPHIFCCALRLHKKLNESGILNEKLYKET